MDATIEKPPGETRASEAPDWQTSPAAGRSIFDRAASALETAQQLYAHDPDWITFFRETLGSHGMVSRLFPTAGDRLAFEATHEHAVIRGMLRDLRGRQADRAARDPTRVITIRLPSSVHDSLKDQARDRKTSMNQLCISKLLQVLGS